MLVFLRSPLAPYMALSATLAMGYGSVFTLLAEFRKRFGFSETELGIITAVGFFAGFVAQIGLARYADRGYTKHLIWAGIASATFGMLALTVADQYWQFVAARTLLGLGSGAVAPALRRLIISRDPEHLGENLGKLTAMEITGFVLGPATAALLAEVINIRAPFIALAVVYALLAIPLARLDLSTPGSTEERLPVRSLLKMKGIQIGLLLGVAIYITIGIFEAVWAVLLDDLGAETWLVGVSLSAFTIPMIVLAPRGGRLAHERGPLSIIKWTIGGAMVAMLIYGWTNNLWIALAASLFHAVVDAFSFPGAQVQIAAASPPEQLAAAQGLFSSSGTLTSGLVAGFGGWAYDEWGPRPLFTAGVAIMAIMVLVAMRIEAASPDGTEMSVPAPAHG